MLPRLAKLLGTSLEALIGDDTSPAAAIPERRSRRGPPSKIELQLDAVARLPKAEQKFVSRMLDSVLGPNLGTGAQEQEAATA